MVRLYALAAAAILVGLPAVAAEPDSAARGEEKASVPDARSSAGRVDFVRDIQPLLARCTNCHGIEKQESGLNLQTRRAAFAGGDNGKVILAGNAKGSRLYQLVAGEDPDLRMPPAGEGEPLTAAQMEQLRLWIEQGANWPDSADGAGGGHWAYRPPQRPEPPTVQDAGWPKNAIDHFILARLEREGLRPAPPLDRARWLRRVSLDLIGLPPTVEEVDAFLADGSDEAFEKAVDRLLASPHYGERWARPWLDLARYADTHGFEKDPHRSIWPYRDWVIQALNRDLPFDQFTIEQLAGDLLPTATVEQRIATGFHRNTMVNTEGGVDAEEYRHLAVVDRVNTTATVWLGTTLACAQCHTHKYDPFTQREYYRLFAFFNSNADPSTSEGEQLAVPSAEQKGAIEELARYAAVGGQSPALQPLREQIASLQKKIESEIPKTLVMRELAAPRETHILARGNFLNPGDKVTPGVPAVLNPLAASNSLPNRLDLARWLVDPGNPLTARVAVNRAWEQFFGRGLVLTSEDFGTKGQPPSHPELLDWLATELVRDQWSLKRLHRRIVLSATYRQSSQVGRELLERDPDNRLLARGPRVRLEAEMVRDQALAASGLLSRKVGGPSVMPPQPDGLWNSPYSGEQWVTSQGEDKYRRGLYTFWKRTSPYPAFVSFDAPSREFCVVRRPRTNTPLQALTTLNDPAFVEAAQGLARRVLEKSPADDRARLTQAFRLVLARAPEADEVERLQALLESELARFRAAPAAAEQMLAGAARTDPAKAAAPSPPSLDRAAWAAWTVVANVLLNLDEALTKG